MDDPLDRRRLAGAEVINLPIRFPVTHDPKKSVQNITDINKIPRLPPGAVDDGSLMACYL